MDEKTVKDRLSSDYEKAKQAAISVLIKGDRVELIPVKDGVKVMRVRREEVKK